MMEAQSERSMFVSNSGKSDRQAGNYRRVRVSSYVNEEIAQTSAELASGSPVRQNAE